MSKYYDNVRANEDMRRIERKTVKRRDDTI